MNKRFIKDISASLTQIFFNQFLGLAIFFITSRYLDKATYGELNWSLAVLTFITTILSLRLEQLVVSRIAAGQNASKLLTLFTGHIVFAGTLFYIILFLCSFLLPDFFKKHDLLLILAISQLLSFFSSPFKQLANGKENFRFLAIMSSVANLVKAGGLLLILFFSSLSIEWILVIYIAASFMELVICYYTGRYLLKVSFSKTGLTDYFILVKESLPLAGAIILNASIARIDWILLGLFTTQEKTAEYSFAYKVFELSPFPLLILAPILLSRFSRFFSSNSIATLLEKKTDIGLLIRMEMIMATMIPLILNITWSPLMDSITEGKYGAVNQLTFFILSCCVPFQYLNNLLWTVNFAQNRLRLIFRITAITFLVILTGDLLFIPLFNTTGAAIVYLLATITEYLNYLWTSSLSRLKETWLSLLICMLSAICCGLGALFFFDSPVIRVLISLPAFCLLLVATKQLGKSDMVYMLRLFKK